MAWTSPKRIQQAKLWMLLGTVCSARRYLIHWKESCTRHGFFLEINGMLSQLYHIEVCIRTRMKAIK